MMDWNNWYLFVAVLVFAAAGYYLSVSGFGAEVVPQREINVYEPRQVSVSEPRKIAVHTLDSGVYPLACVLAQTEITQGVTLLSKIERKLGFSVVDFSGNDIYIYREFFNYMDRGGRLHGAEMGYDYILASMSKCNGASGATFTIYDHPNRNQADANLLRVVFDLAERN